MGIYRGKISDDDIVSAVKTAVIPIIEQMEQAFNEGNFMQADEVRYKEDMPALGLNWIRLGLDDVLYDPKSKTIYTPNTNASVKVGEGGIAVSDELQYNENHDDRGRFTFGASGGSGSAQKDWHADVYGKKGSSEKPLTKYENGVKLDSNGKPFRYPEVRLDDPKEYRMFMDQVDLRYDTHYKGKTFCAIAFTDKTIYFENHGRSDYNIYKVEEV